jgi:shikimate dehydrogenase
VDAIYGVTGKPVFHSRSPAIFNGAFRACGISSVYTRVAVDSAEEAIHLMRAIGIRGLNVTSPFKEDIMGYLDAIEPGARAIGAVNTVVSDDGILTGHNTDAAGVVGALKAGNVALKGRKAVVLGAGGAGKAAVYGLLSEGASVTIVNRDPERARGVAATFGCSAVPMEVVGDAIREAHIFISSVPSTDTNVDSGLLRKDLAILDANYSLPSALVRQGQAQGCTIIDGTEWLFHQALPAFTLFTGKQAPEAVMRAVLRRENRRDRKNVALIGFMGSGKSTIGRGIVGPSGMTLLDIDELIEHKTGHTVEEIFSDMGEDAFRGLEREVIENISHLTGNMIACGGGTVTCQENADALKKEAIVVWLWAGVDTILERIGDGTGRPLMRGYSREKRVRGLLAERLPLYARSADIIIHTDGKRPEETMERIWYEISKSIGNQGDSRRPAFEEHDGPGHSSGSPVRGDG